jgi:hypothetical protein
MKIFNLEDLRALKPCYDPATKLGSNWSGTLLDILNDSRVPDDDKIWAVTKLVDDKTARLFAVYCARESFKYITNKKLLDICTETCNVAERFANGLATKEELSAAWSAESAAYSAAGSAAESAAWSAAYSAAFSAAESARSAGWSARSAAYSAAWSADSAAYSAAYSTESATYLQFVKHLATMLTPQATIRVPDEQEEVIISYEVLKYFGNKLKDNNSKELFMKALEVLK